jgi:predicted nuclease of predicted toxin-antitoxin system
MLPCFGDESVQEAILLGLRTRGVEISWVQERNQQGMDDEQVADLALSERRVLLTTDQDFLVLSAAAAVSGSPFPPVIFWPQQSRSVGVVISRVLQLIDRDDYDQLMGLLMFV